MRIYLATPRLRGLLALNLSVAAAGAMVIVNTVVVVRGLLGRPDGDLALALGCFGGGSMLAALYSPRLLDRWTDRTVMLTAAGWLGALLIVFATVLVAVLWFSVRTSTTVAVDLVWPSLLVIWTLLGIGYSAILVPTGRLLRRSAHAADRPALFAAQFALSHACWLLTYPLAGWLGAAAGLPLTLIVLGGLTWFGLILAALLWPADGPEVLPHEHPDLAADDPHLTEHFADGRQHAHVFMIDDLHRWWPAAR